MPAREARDPKLLRGSPALHPGRGRGVQQPARGPRRLAVRGLRWRGRLLQAPSPPPEAGGHRNPPVLIRAVRRSVVLLVLVAAGLAGGYALGHLGGADV